MKAVDRSLKAVAHLNLVDKQEVLLAGRPMLFYVGEQRVIFEQLLELIEVVVDVNDIRIGQVGLYVVAKGFEQFRFTAAANTRDDLDIRHADEARQRIHIRRSLDEFHWQPPFGLSLLFLKTEYFSVLRNRACIEYTSQKVELA